MDNKFYTDNFERLLREKSDEFKMYPSKRVWHSVYNNLHPGRRWPSVTMCITLIATLLMVGYLNTDISREDAYNNATKNPATGNQSFYSSFIHPFTQFSNTSKQGLANTSFNPINTISATFISNEIASVSNESLSNTETVKAENSYSLNNAPKATPKKTLAFAYSIRKIKTSIVNADASSSAAVADNSLVTVGIKTTENSIAIENSFPSAKITEDNTDSYHNTLGNTTSGNSFNATEEKNNSSLLQEDIQDKKAITAANESDKEIVKNEIADKKNPQEITTNKAGLTDVQKEWIENYALYNRPAPKKWAGKLAWQAYVTPSVVYRKLYSINPAKAGISIPPNSNNMIVNRPSAGLEMGGGFKYALSKTIKLTVGLQLNYTRYNIHTFENTHPISTTVGLLDPQTYMPHDVYRSTIYSNIYGVAKVNLHNETYQLSIPLGAEVKLAGTEEGLQWYAGATIQPTILLHATSYLLSSDRVNYVKDGTYLNRFNLNAGFESFVTYKTSNGLTWQFGPQFRTQLFTTNSRVYSVGEKLMNFGFKFGITKNL